MTEFLEGFIAKNFKKSYYEQVKFFLLKMDECDFFETTVKGLVNFFKELGGGYDALVCRRALAYEMRKLELEVIDDFNCPVFYDDDVELGTIHFDLVVDRRFIIAVTTEQEFDLREENRLKRFMEV